MQQHHQTFSLRASSRDAGLDDECMTNCDVAFLIFPQSTWNTSRLEIFCSPFIFLNGGRLTCRNFKQDSAQHAPSNISAFDCTHLSLQTCPIGICPRASRVTLKRVQLFSEFWSRSSNGTPAGSNPASDNIHT